MRRSLHEEYFRHAENWPFDSWLLPTGKKCRKIQNFFSIDSKYYSGARTWTRTRDLHIISVTL